MKLFNIDYKLYYYKIMIVFLSFAILMFSIFIFFNLEGYKYNRSKIISLTFIFAIILLIFLILTILRVRILRNITKYGKFIDLKLLGIKLGSDSTIFYFSNINGEKEKVSKVEIHTNKKLKEKIKENYAIDDVIKVKYLNNVKTIIIPDFYEN